MIEEWKDIKDYEGLYEVSSHGRVKGLGGKTSKHGLNGFYERMMSLQLGDNGYLSVALVKNGKRTKYKVHRLVCQEFVANFLNKPQVNHIDGNKLNNASYNLEWVSPSENMMHALCSGLISKSITRSLPLGVTMSGNRFRATHAKKNIGTFGTIEDAHLAYQKAIFEKRKTSTIMPRIF